MWRELLEALGGAGYRAVAPDLAGFGDSPADRPGTWERHVEALEEFRQAQELDDVVLVVHDWGGLIGLRWACDHPGAAPRWSSATPASSPTAGGTGLARPCAARAATT